MLYRLLRGNTLALIGLFLGLTAGAIVLSTKNWLVAEIVSALEEEVVASCECTLAFDSMSLSFSTLSVRARNVRILERGTSRLSFKEISGKVDISEIRERKIHLSTLILRHGTADGVGPDSVAFRFIDQLTKPLPPEKQKPDRWRVILDTLEIQDSFLRESFGSSEISGSGVSLFVKRIGETFSLLPQIADLRFISYGETPGEQASQILLGPLAGSVVIEDERTVFNSLILGREKSRIEAKMIAASDTSNTTSGSANFVLTPDYLGLPDWLKGTFTGSTTIRGTLGSPLLTGTLKNAENAAMILAFPHASQLTLPQLSSQITVDVNHGDPIVTLSKLESYGDGSTLTSSHPLTFSERGLSAGFKVSVPSFNYGPFVITNSKAEISIDETQLGLITTVEAFTENLIASGISLGPAKVKIKLSGDNVEVSVDSTNRLQGALNWNGVVDLTKSEPILTSGLLKLDRFRYPLALPIAENNLSPVAISTNFSLSGPLTLNRLNGDGDTTVFFPSLNQGFPLAGRTTLKDGVLKASLPTSAHAATTELTIDLFKTLDGKLRVSLPTIKLKDVLGYDDPCSVLGGNLSYNFPLNQALSGSGELVLEALSIGCNPYSLRLPNFTRIPIKGGALQFKNLNLSTLDSLLELNGEVGLARGFEMSAKGRLELSSLLPLLPSIDDLQGLLQTDISIKGSLREPTVVGTAQLSKGQFGVSSPEVGGDSIAGDFSLSGKSILIRKLTGKINNGTFSASGTMLPFDPTHSTLQTTLNQVTIEPLEDASITFTGDLALGAAKNARPVLSGNVNITFAEVAKDFDINKIIISAISGYFLPSRVQPITSKQKAELDLDVRISAPRNVFVVTPFLSAELNTNLVARGNALAPALDGSMQVLSGWIGLKGNRFDITAGGLFFKPPSLLPTLEVASEGTLRAPTGENVLVILEASGPVSNPKISLSSDRGLSQSELLLLLTSSRRLGESSLRGRMGTQFGAEQRFFISDSSFASLKDFFANLTRLDILSFEPSYNQFTGTIEPAVVARKNISPRLTLMGESLFSSVSNSKAGAVYALTPSLDINGFFQTVSTQKNSILSSDFTYTVWAEESQFISFEIAGPKEFSEQSIFNAARLGPSSRIINTPESLSGIQNQISRYLHEQGYQAGDAHVTCLSGEKFCQKLKIVVNEGLPTIIETINFEGSNLPDNLIKSVTSTAQIGSLATSSVLDTIERKLVVALRNDGYISARVTPRYVLNKNHTRATLVVNSDIREPISFSFSGNSLFAADDFLNSIELFSRKRPFGNNTIKILIQNIERMYQESGYLFVQVAYSEDRSNPNRLQYRINIIEESRVQVRELLLEGNFKISRKRLIKVMSEIGMSEQAALFDIPVADQQQLDALKDAIREVYYHEGYPDVRVNYHINRGNGEKTLNVVYSITEGRTLLASKVMVKGYPAELSMPLEPSTPISLPRVNSHIDKLLESLKNAGYLFPAISTEASADFSLISISIQPGYQIIVGSMSYEGLVNIKQETAERVNKLRIGAPFRADDANQTKRDLLRTGLFSRVEIVAQDGALDAPREGVIVRVVERPLQTLQLGAGANSEFGLHTFGEAVNKSLFADGRTLSLRVDTYFDQAGINPNGTDLISQGFTSGRYVDPSLFGSDYSLTEEIRYQRQELSTQEFNLDRLLFGSYVLRQVSSELTFSAGHSLILDNLQDVTPGAEISDLDNGSVRLSFISGVLKYDKRDDPLLPRSGYTLSLEPKVSFEAIGSEANFISAIARGTSIVPLSTISSRYSLGVGLSAGIAEPFGNTEEIPITQRFYLGGRTTVRGFRENSLGPRDSDGAVIGGNALLAAKSQLQYLAAESVSTHLFFDLGNVFLLDNDKYYDFEIRKSIGLGFQYLSPIGPIGFDVGRPLGEKSGEPSIRVHFSVGSMF